jgi:predicted MPP superfamily phosphohydrolase
VTTLSVAVASATVASATAGLGWSLVEAQAFALRHLRVRVLPPGSPEVRVLHISDLHLLPRQRRKVAWVRALAQHQPDLVVSTGDNLAHPDAVPHVLEAYGPLLERPGVFVLGSNDYFGPAPKNPARYLARHGGRRRITGCPLPTDDLVRGMCSGGWQHLTNRRARLEVNGLTLTFRGVDDAHLKQDRYQEVAGPVSPGDGVSLGVMHAPYLRTVNAMATDGVGLLLAGHTHGGQLCLPWVGTLVTNCDLPRRNARGLTRWTTPTGEQTWLHVSAGLGTSPFTPVRFACRPEATLLTLHAVSE